MLARSLVALVLLVLLAGPSAHAAVALEPDRLLFGTYASLDPDQDALLILTPRVGFDERTAARLEAFLEDGGRVLLAGLRGSGAELLDRLDAGVHAEQASLYSLATGGPPLVRGTGAWSDVDHMETAGNPRVLEGTGEVLLTTHEFTWLDRDDDAEPDLGEPRGRFPVAMRAEVGQGQLLVLSVVELLDPQAPDALRVHVEDWLTEDGRRVVVQDARHEEAARLGTLGRVLTGETWPPVLLAFTVLVLLLVALGVRLRRRPEAPRRVRPLPPPRSDLEVRAVEELGP